MAVMIDKFMTAQEAVSRYVKDGDQIALGGFTVNRNPMMITREIIRQKTKDLYLVVHSHGQALELLIGAGCVSRLELAYGGVARFAPTGQRFKKAVKEKKIEVEDYSNFQMTLRFLAGAMGLPYIVTKSGLETDIVKTEGFSKESRGQGKIPQHKLKVVENSLCPQDGNVVILPPLTPDVTLLHAQYAGEDGTIRIQGLTFADIEQAKAAGRVIVSCERVLPTEEIRRDPDQNCLPHFLVDAIVVAPFGAHPTACHMYYDYDPFHLANFAKIASNELLFQKYLDEWVYGIDTQEKYMAKIGDSDIGKIKADPVLGYAPGLDRR
jgi:glutaconate CoA-transferase subunit A